MNKWILLLISLLPLAGCGKADTNASKNTAALEMEISTLRESVNAQDKLIKTLRGEINSLKAGAADTEKLSAEIERLKNTVSEMEGSGFLK